MRALLFVTAVLAGLVSAQSNVCVTNVAGRAVPACVCTGTCPFFDFNDFVIRADIGRLTTAVDFPITFNTFNVQRATVFTCPIPASGNVFTACSDVACGVPVEFETFPNAVQVRPGTDLFVGADTNRVLCLRTTNQQLQESVQFAGVVITADFQCTTDADCGVVSVPFTAFVNTQFTDPLERQANLQRATCCTSGVSPFTRGTCINTNVQNCCGGPINQATTRCCNRNTGTTVPVGQNCPCTAADVANERATNQAACPNNETCCLPTRFPELLVEGLPVPSTVGQCFNPIRGVERCCDTGEVYDSGSSQCCPINGVQTINVPCPCGVDTDCPATIAGEAGPFRCCKRFDPVPQETELCNIYINFPSGIGPFQAQTCLGQCYDQRFQQCCNGAICQYAYEMCCNSTCCNRYVGTCQFGRRPGSAGSRFNFRNFIAEGVPIEEQLRFGEVKMDNVREYEMCSYTEAMTPIRAFRIFLIPLFMLILTVFVLAIALVVANKASSRRFLAVERLIIVTALFIMICSVPIFFSPLWKYGAFAVLVAALAISTAALVFNPLTIIVIILSIVLWLYLVDPFTANTYINFLPIRTAQGVPSPVGYGILHFANNFIWPNDPINEVDNGPLYNRNTLCTDFYDYFMFDPDLKDFERYDNPYVWTFGYCSRGWAFVLLIFGAFFILFATILVLLLLVLFLYRTQRVELPDIQLQVVGGDGPAPVPIY